MQVKPCEHLVSHFNKMLRKFLISDRTVFVLVAHKKFNCYKYYIPTYYLTEVKK